MFDEELHVLMIENNRLDVQKQKKREILEAIVSFARNSKLIKKIVTFSTFNFVHKSFFLTLNLAFNCR